MMTARHPHSIPTRPFAAPLAATGRPVLESGHPARTHPEGQAGTRNYPTPWRGPSKRLRLPSCFGTNASPITRVRELFSLAWLHAHENVVFCGPVGVGKSFLASALGHSACRAGAKVQSVKAARLLQALHQSRADNSFDRELRSWVAPDLVILDDFGLRKLTAQQSSDLYDVLVERHAHAST